VNRLEVWIDDALLGGSALVGHLSKASSRTGEAISFEYESSWLTRTGSVDGFALDHDLYFGAGQNYAKSGANQLSSVFQDCSPDRWGKRLMDRREAIEAREGARKPRSLRAWDYLVDVNDDSRLGALRLVDTESKRYLDDRTLSAPPITELRRLESIAAHIERGDADTSDEMVQWIKQFVAPGAALGGARPKASFRDQAGQLWLAKFPSNDDRINVGMWEFLTYQLSLDAGIDMPKAKLMKFSDRGHTFAVQRFDRTNGSRRMYSSAMTQLGVTESEGCSYLDIVQAIETEGTSTQIAHDLEQLFRRVLFNILIGNRDDHLRNHGFLRTGDGWQLSPAFDVNPNPDKDHHVLAINDGDTSPDSRLLLATSDYYRLNTKAAGAVVDHVRNAVRSWESRARGLSVPMGDIGLMQAVFDPDR